MDVCIGQTEALTDKRALGRDHVERLRTDDRAGTADAANDGPLALPGGRVRARDQRCVLGEPCPEPPLPPAPPPPVSCFVGVSLGLGPPRALNEDRGTGCPRPGTCPAGPVGKSCPCSRTSPGRC